MASILEGMNQHEGDQRNAQPPSSAPERTVRILLVDDSDEFIASLKRFLSKSNGLQVVECARNGRDALELITKADSDLVLMDILMPRINGIELTHHVKMMNRPPKVIVVSLYDTSEFRSLAGLAQADGFVSKSQIGTQLIPMIDTLFPKTKA